MSFQKDGVTERLTVLRVTESYALGARSYACKFTRREECFIVEDKSAGLTNLTIELRRNDLHSEREQGCIRRWIAANQSLRTSRTDTDYVAELVSLVPHCLNNYLKN
jgi:hypothetical protein